WVPSLASSVIFGSRPILIRLITLAANCAGARSAVNPHAACDVADVGDGATEHPNRARRRKPRTRAKDEPTGHRASVRPYQVHGTPEYHRVGALARHFCNTCGHKKRA